MKFSRLGSPYAVTAAALLVATSCFLSVFTLDGASAQTRTIKLINPFPPGGTGDIIARLVTEQIGRTRGVTFVIEDRPGAGTVIGAELVARSRPDGNTILLGTSALLISAHLHKLNFDPIGGFEPVCNLVQSPQLLFVNADSPYRTMADFIAAARAKPGELTLSSTGPATTAHIGFERVKRAANLTITYVPFPGNAPTVNAVLGGHVTAGIANYADLIGHFQAGKLRPLVTLTPARIAPLPDLPTVAEAGYKEFEYTVWFGVTAAAKTPPQTIAQLSDWFSAALDASEVKTKLAAQGLYPAKACGADFAAVIRKDYDDYGRVIRAANIKAE
jgi:tripartite-type tricarboxylate transporter receptor subunit TctC